VLSVKEEDYIEAAKAVGESDLRIVFSHVLPNILSVVIVRAPQDLGLVILNAATLGYLGVGAQPPMPEWGAMVSAGRNYIMHQWWLTIFPSLFIVIAVLGFMLLGDGLRDALDPRLRK